MHHTTIARAVDSIFLANICVLLQWKVPATTKPASALNHSVTAPTSWCIGTKCMKYFGHIENTTLVHTPVHCPHCRTQAILCRHCLGHQLHCFPDVWPLHEAQRGRKPGGGQRVNWDRGWTQASALARPTPAGGTPLCAWTGVCSIGMINVACLCQYPATGSKV